MKKQYVLNNTLEVKYGLPSQVLFCKTCNITNQRPNSTNEFKHSKDSKKTTISFDEQGVCSACQHKERQNQTINWQDREQALIDLCNQHRLKRLI